MFSGDLISVDSGISLICVVLSVFFRVVVLVGLMFFLLVLIDVFVLDLVMDIIDILLD